MVSEDLKLDNYDKTNLHIFKKHINPQDMISDGDLKATQEELLQQENLKKMLQYDSVEKSFISRLTIMNYA